MENRSKRDTRLSLWRAEVPRGRWWSDPGNEPVAGPSRNREELTRSQVDEFSRACRFHEIKDPGIAAKTALSVTLGFLCGGPRSHEAVGGLIPGTSLLPAPQGTEKNSPVARSTNSRGPAVSTK